MSYNIIALLDDLLKRSATPDAPAMARPVIRRAIGPERLPMDWRIEWEERAAIMEYDGGLPRERAEALALDDILAQMRRAGVGLLREAA